MKRIESGQWNKHRLLKVGHAHINIRPSYQHGGEAQHYPLLIVRAGNNLCMRTSSCYDDNSNINRWPSLALFQCLEESVSMPASALSLRNVIDSMTSALIACTLNLAPQYSYYSKKQTVICTYLLTFIDLIQEVLLKARHLGFCP